jgi:hypothetical protein
MEEHKVTNTRILEQKYMEKHAKGKPQTNKNVREDSILISSCFENLEKVCRTLKKTGLC